MSSDYMKLNEIYFLLDYATEIDFSVMPWIDYVKVDGMALQFRKSK